MLLVPCKYESHSHCTKWDRPSILHATSEIQPTGRATSHIFVRYVPETNMPL